MSDLTNLTPAQSFGDLLNLNNPASPGQGFTNVLVNVTDGLGNLCPLQLSTDTVNVNSFSINAVLLTASATTINSVCNSEQPNFEYATSSVVLARGTTAQRPAGGSLHLGSIRFNSQTSQFEGYDGVSWKVFTLT